MVLKLVRSTRTPSAATLGLRQGRKDCQSWCAAPGPCVGEAVKAGAKHLDSECCHTRGPIALRASFNRLALRARLNERDGAAHQLPMCGRRPTPTQGALLGLRPRLNINALRSANSRCGADFPKCASTKNLRKFSPPQMLNRLSICK